MTNDQQMTLGQVSGSEPHQTSQQQQESFQLTELLPVEQSRLKDNPGDKDHETTDGLKALRSFSRAEQHVFEAQGDFVGYRKLEAPYETNIDGDEESEEDNESNSKKRRTSGESKTNGFRITRRIALEQERAENNVKMKNAKKNKKRRKINVADDFSCDEDEDYEPNASKRKRRVTGRSNSTKDEDENEVYHYRQQQLEPCETSNNGESNLEILSAGVYRDMANNFSDVSRAKYPPKNDKASASKNKRVKKSEKQRKAADKKDGVKNKRRSSRREPKSKDSERKTKKSPKVSLSNRAEAEKDLRLKVDGIIQASYLLERENNNVVRRNNNEKGTRSSASSVNKGSKKNSAGKSVTGSEVRSSEEKSSKQAECEEQTIKKYSCVMCSSRFKGSGGLRNHYKVVHGAGPLYKCDDCGKEFPLKERLKLHVRTHTGFKPYKCPDCHKSFARGGQLVQHRGTHSKVKPYRCNLCAGTFTCAANLVLHVKRHNGQKDHKCEICGRGFVRKDALKKHLECLHRDVKSFLCVICNKTFKGHLPQHMRTHAQDRPHGCATCGQRFAQKSQLTVHQRTHSGQRPFRCLVCWQAFAHSTALKLHTRRHTGERPFKCAECNAGFTQLPHWKKHMKCIHGRTEPYSCKNCNSFFRIKNDLETHEKMCRDDDSIDEDDSSRSETSESTGGRDCSTAIVDSPKFRVMSVERMRLLLAVLLKRISKPERLDELGFGKRLIDEVLQDSLISAGKEPTRIGRLTEHESLRKNLETFLEWTVPKEHWDMFQKSSKTPEQILETLTAT